MTRQTPHKKRKHSDRVIEIDPASAPQGSGTYTWQVQSNKTGRYIDCIEDSLHQNVSPFLHPNKSEFVLVQMSGGIDSIQLSHYEKYFVPTLLEADLRILKDDFSIYNQIVMPKEIYDDINSLIKENNLSDLEDFLLRIIIIGQKATILGLQNKKVPTTHNEITSLSSDIQRLIRVIDLTTFDFQSWLQTFEDRSDELDYIKFVFKNAEAISIKNSWLQGEILNLIRNHFDNQEYKNWRKQLEQVPNRFTRRSKTLKFGKYLTRAYYNFFTLEEVFDLESPFKSDLMLLIADILSLSYIYPENVSNKDSERANQIRTWLLPGRHEFETATNLEENPDLTLLKQYFDPNFIDLADSKKYKDSISVATFICERFEIAELIPELTHISTSIRSAVQLLGHHFSSTTSRKIPLPEYQSIIKLLEGLRAGKKITSLNITTSGDGGPHQFSQRMPLFLIEQALKTYFEQNRVEFESDIVTTRVENNPGNQNSITTQDRFNLPHERFFVRLLDPLIQFLEDYASPGEIKSRVWYFRIIAVLYRDNGVFHHQNEELLVDKIEHWYSLNAES